MPKIDIGARSLRHGHAARGKTTKEWNSWRGMMERCTNPRHIGFKYYGARGITVCERWKDFALFLADMGPKPSPRHTIDRIKTEGNYEPGNCRWATSSEQRANQRPQDDSARVRIGWASGKRSRKSALRIDLTGLRFGRLLVLECAGLKKGRVAWVCQCSCGAKPIIIGKSLRKGTARSCGCLMREISRENAIKRNQKVRP